MKQSKYLVLLLALVFALTACPAPLSDGDDDASTEESALTDDGEADKDEDE
ncbi:MAG: hypothetical protein ACRCYY_13445 [Trueperaceae bacterium]